MILSDGKTDRQKAIFVNVKNHMALAKQSNTSLDLHYVDRNSFVSRNHRIIKFN